MFFLIYSTSYPTILLSIDLAAKRGYPEQLQVPKRLKLILSLFIMCSSTENKFGVRIKFKKLNILFQKGHKYDIKLTIILQTCG